MRTATLAATLLTSSTLLLTTHAQLIPFLIKGEPSTPYNGLNTNPKPAPARQRPMDPASNQPAPGIVLPNPPSNGKDKDAPADNDNGNTIILSDIITTDSRINIFASFTRSVSTVSARLETSSLNTTVLAPLNRAITALPRKPWEDPREYAALGSTAYDGASGEDRAQRNLRKFTEAHIVPCSPWKEGEKVETVGGGKVWWEKREGGKSVVMPGEIEVEGVGERVGNGEVWVLEGVVNYAS